MSGIRKTFLCTLLTLYSHFVHTCVVADCGRPAPPANGRVTVSSTTAGSLALYSCNEGHRLVGHRQRTCSASNGEWTYSAPSCQSEFIIVIAFVIAFPVYCCKSG